MVPVVVGLLIYTEIVWSPLFKYQSHSFIIPLIIIPLSKLNPTLCTKSNSFEWILFILFTIFTIFTSAGDLEAVICVYIYVTALWWGHPLLWLAYIPVGSIHNGYFAYYTQSSFLVIPLQQVSMTTSLSTCFTMNNAVMWTVTPCKPQITNPIRPCLLPPQKKISNANSMPNTATLNPPIVTSTLKKKIEIANQLVLSCTEFEGIDINTHNLIEGYRPGYYMHIQLTNLPCQIIENFGPIYPIIVWGQFSYLLENILELLKSLWNDEDGIQGTCKKITILFGMKMIPKYLSLSILLTTTPSAWLLYFLLFWTLHLTLVSVLLIHYGRLHPGLGLLLLK